MELPKFRPKFRPSNNAQSLDSRSVHQFWLKAWGGWSKSSMLYLVSMMGKSLIGSWPASARPHKAGNTHIISRVEISPWYLWEAAAAFAVFISFFAKRFLRSDVYSGIYCLRWVFNNRQACVLLMASLPFNSKVL